MKTYVDYIKSTDLTNKVNAPILRSSAIFPFLVNEYLDTRILFLGYWFLKRNIADISTLITIRREKGVIIIRENFNINNIKAFSVSIKNELIKKNIHIKKNLKGSIEIEVFSKKNLVYAFPAIVVNYNSKYSSTFTHTCGRTFNDINDKRTSLKFLPPETGFDILPGKNMNPFFSFVNGDVKLKNKKINLEIICDNKKIIKKNILIKKLNPYETKFVFFLNYKDKKHITTKSSLRIRHNFNSFFPRFLSGNFTKNFTNSSLTHSYYDLRKYSDKKHFWENHDPVTYFDYMISIPIFCKQKYYTELVIYPNFYFKNIIKFNIEIFNKSGELIKKINNFFVIKNKFIKPYYLNINKMFQDFLILNKKYEYLFARITTETKFMPTRLKFGLNIGYSSDLQPNLPSNVCFNGLVPDNFTAYKKGTLKWAPLINKNDSKIIISNMSNLKKRFRSAKLTLKFWREKDNKFIKKSLQLNDNGSFCFDLNKNIIIKNFFNKKPGWVTIESDNPYVNGYYFEFNGLNVIGADHFF